MQRKKETTSKFPLLLLEQFILSLKWIIRAVDFRNAKDYMKFVSLPFLGLRSFLGFEYLGLRTQRN